MQHDEMIWQVINHQFCSYKTTIGKALSDKTLFCRHPYSVTGLCNRTSCPLANSKYATIREEAGKINLYMKTVERAHSPKNLWERIQLSRNYSKALQQLDEHLAYFPKVLFHRNKQRLTKIHQYLIRIRKLKLKEMSGRKAKMVGIHRKIDQREERRERKAMVAAKLETTIQQELVQRLAKGTYGDIYNFPETAYQKALSQVEDEQEEETEQMSEEGEEEESESESEDGVVEYVEDFDSEEDEEEEEDIEEMDYLGEGQWGPADESEEDGDDDDDDEEEDDDDDDDDETKGSTPSKKGEDKPKAKPKSDKKGPPQRGRRGTRIQIEYEEEHEEEANPRVAAAAVASNW